MLPIICINMSYHADVQNDYSHFYLTPQLYCDFYTAFRRSLRIRAVISGGGGGAGDASLQFFWDQARQSVTIANLFVVDVDNRMQVFRKT